MSTVWDVARIAIYTLRQLGYQDVCLIGSAACALYGATRVPKDVDILVLTTRHKSETIKGRIAAIGPSFHRERPKGKPYTKLYYTPDDALFPGSSAIKVDILVPGALQIPRFSACYIKHVKLLNIPFIFPVVPFPLLIIMKLHAWCQDFRQRQYKHRADLDPLVAIAQRKKLMGVCSFIHSRVRGRARWQAIKFMEAFPSSRINHVLGRYGIHMPRKSIAARTRQVFLRGME